MVEQVIHVAYFLLTTAYVHFATAIVSWQLIMYILQTVEQLRTNYCKATCTVIVYFLQSMVSIRCITKLFWLILYMYVHTRVFHETGIQYMFVKRIGKSATERNWEKNATELNETGEETLRSRMVEETLRSRMVEETLRNRTALSFSVHSVAVQ